MPRILILLLALPVLELTAFVLVAAMIGVGKAVLLQLAISLIGFAMLGSLVGEARTRARTSPGGVLSFALDKSHGLRGLAGLLFTVPGFITDVIGVMALVPEFRARLRRFIGGTPPAPVTVQPAARPAPGDIIDLDAREWREATGRERGAV